MMKHKISLLVIVFLSSIVGPMAGPNGNGPNGNNNPSTETPNICGDPDLERYDVVVVGAGWAGIKSAHLLHTYKMSLTNPNSFNFAVLEMSNNWKRIGRGTAARYLMGGDGDPIGNPIAELLVTQLAAKTPPSDLEDYKEDFEIIDVFDETVASYFDETGAVRI